MAILEYHTSLSDKKKFFKDCSEINTMRDFDFFYDKYREEKEFVYRGMGTSKNMLYNSAQRFWILNELGNWNLDYHLFIKKYIDKVRSENRGTVNRFFDKVGVAEDDFAILSFIQHHGGPTPLLDFTESFKIALYFACTSSKIEESNNSLDSYVSVYMLYKDVKKLFRSPIERNKKDYFDNKAMIIQERLPEAIKIFKEYNVLYSQTPILTIENDMTKDELSHSLYTSFNITNQEGLFIYNNDPIKPLEKQIQDNDLLKAETDTSALISCRHFHKNLIPHILKTIGEAGITESYLFPKAESLVNESLKDLISDSSVTLTY